MNLIEQVVFIISEELSYVIFVTLFEVKCFRSTAFDAENLFHKKIEELNSRKTAVWPNTWVYHGLFLIVIDVP